MMKHGVCRYPSAVHVCENLLARSSLLNSGLVVIALMTPRSSDMGRQGTYAVPRLGWGLILRLRLSPQQVRILGGLRRKMQAMGSVYHWKCELHEAHSVYQQDEPVATSAKLMQVGSHQSKSSQSATQHVCPFGKFITSSNPLHCVIVLNSLKYKYPFKSVVP